MVSGRMDIVFEIFRWDFVMVGALESVFFFLQRHCLLMRVVCDGSFWCLSNDGGDVKGGK